MRRRYRQALGIGLLGLLALPAAAQGQGNLDGRIRISLVNEEVDQVSETDRLQQLYQLQWRRRMSSIFNYLLRLRYEDIDQDTRFDSFSGTSGRSILEPTLQLEWSARLWSLSTGYRWTEQRRKLVDLEDRDVRGDWFTRFGWRPVNGPTVAVLYDRVDARSDNRSLDRTDQRLLGDVSYRAGPVGFLYNFQGRGTTDRVIDVERDSQTHALAVDYRSRFLRNRLSLITVGRGELDKVNEGTSATARIEEEIPAIQGLFAVDTTPLLGPLAPEPALIDGDVNTPTSINIGGTASGGGIDRNIGLDFDVAEPVDRLDLYVDVLLTPLQASRYGWEIYVSDDNLTWARSSVGITSLFNNVFKRFEMSFSPVTARYLKLVNTSHDPSVGPVLVTELVAFMTDLLVGERQRRTRTFNANLNLSYAPTPRWSFTSSTFFGWDRQKQEPSRIEATEDRLDQGLAAIFSPSRLVSFAGRASVRVRNRSDTPDQRDTIFTVGAASTPLRNLDLALSVGKRFEDRNSFRTLEADRADLRVGTQLTRRLNLAVDLGFIDQVRPQTATGSVTRSTRVALFTDPRPELSFSSDLQLDRTESEDLTTGGTVFTELFIWTNRILWRPTQMFSLRGELRQEDLPQGSGLSKFLSVDWLPLPGGRLQWTFALLIDSQAVTGGERDQFRSFLRWFLRPNVFVDFNYFFDRAVSQGLERRLQSFTVAIEIRF